VLSCAVLTVFSDSQYSTVLSCAVLTVFSDSQYSTVLPCAVLTVFSDSQYSTVLSCAVLTVASVVKTLSIMHGMKNIKYTKHHHILSGTAQFVVRLTI
jgi:hypothetical protein